MSESMCGHSKSYFAPGAAEDRITARDKMEKTAITDITETFNELGIKLTAEQAKKVMKAAATYAKSLSIYI